MTTERPHLLIHATFGELLRRWRRGQGLKQGELGKLLQPKARTSTVSCWENDVRRPSRKYLSQIVALTGIPADLALELPQREEARP
jgi:transcriptional regulator with XRE-family HTH domain